MHDDTTQADASTVVDRKWIAWTRRIAIVALAFGVLYCWFWVVTISKAFGPHPAIRLRILGGLAGLVVLVVLAERHARRLAGWERRTSLAWTLTAMWSIAGAAIWLAFCSPFSRDASIAIGFVAASWWLLWTWLMFFVTWPWSRRVSVLAALIVLMGGVCYAWTVDGIDGAALPKLVWIGHRDTDAQETFRPAETPAGERTTTIDDGTNLPLYPRFRGADGTGISRGVRLARDWAKRMPVLRWRRSVGLGFGAIAVSGSRVYTQEQRGEFECVVCYERATGRELWVHREKAHYQNPSIGDGPRATPTVAGETVFSLGATGILTALDRRSGEVSWTKNVMTDNEATAPGHGVTGAPLVVEDSVIVSAGGANGASLVAYDRATGRRAWRAGSDPASYASPLAAEMAGSAQILMVNTQTLCGHDAATGEILWTFPWGNDQNTNCSQPCVVGENRVFASTNYGTGCVLLELSRGDGGKWSSQPLWKNRTMQTKFSSPVIYDGHAYGLDDEILQCISLDNGQRAWKRGRYGHGQLLLADDLLVIQAEDGRLALVQASPDSFIELGQFQALEGKTWNYPALAGSHIFVRNDRQAACWELPVEEE